MRNLIIAASLAAIVAPAVPAFAAPHRDHRYDSRYDDRGRYREPRRLSRSDQVWRGSDGRMYCKRDNGTTGLIIGGALGALAGRQIDGGQNRTLGTILGAAGGGLLGREIDKGELKCS